MSDGCNLLAFAKLIESKRQERLHAAPGFTANLAARRAKYPGLIIQRRYGPRPGQVPKSNGTDKAEAERWLAVCAELCRAASDFDAETRRGYTIACRLTGLGWNDVQHAMADVYFSDAKRAAAAWAPFMKTADARYQGFVYLAMAPAHPSARKIGFSTSPTKRVKGLARSEGTPVVLLAETPGTMLHEWALHMLLFPRLRAEWYPTEIVPDWLFPVAVSEAA
jgi:hypothetical protein